ncbi:cation transporter [Novosphingobium sp. CF614]|uniref:cation transporter n=1 Tax=Novosphingobium sp. CF614 TaxID=1884364 RepID=UPI000B896ADB|nr:cation transporter [Novosphingobium sp. CF614]
MSDDCCASKGLELERLAQEAGQRRVLVAVLLINAVMFVAEFGGGLVAGSTALMADALDNLGDALVYAVSLYAITRSERWKAGAAAFKGVFILLLGVSIVVNVAIKIGSGVAPSSSLMLMFGAAALAANLACLALLWRFRSHDVNMASTFECSRNDVVSNCGVLLAAAAVGVTGSSWPDILIGSVMALIVLRSAVRVLRAAIAQIRSARA